MSEKVRIAVAGCGGISHAHLRGYRTLLENGIDTFRITAACDVEKDRADRVAEDIVSGKIEGYQKELNEKYGLG